ncbi:MAG: hypothetical protein COU65_00230 [Candidatus Pacebacteria bacterium CG10_big_fil_rev_8_21_14_0_10_42_12]|nr:MAG: hypothetical protein COU65_00230 [Candidatus Pacebacteria bacterium CG10_big_fil_rev_8_21_14_0_10_42_12]
MTTIVQNIIPVLEKYGVKKASLFGSYARGTQDQQSDVDILIDPPAGMGIKIVHLQRDLEATLQKKVDVVSYNGISRYMKNNIMSNQVSIL